MGRCGLWNGKQIRNHQTTALPPHLPRTPIISLWIFICIASLWLAAKSSGTQINTKYINDITHEYTTNKIPNAFCTTY